MVDEDFLRLLLLSSAGRLFLSSSVFCYAKSTFSQGEGKDRDVTTGEAWGATILPYRASDDARAASSYDTLCVTMSGFAAFEDKRRKQARRPTEKTFSNSKKQPKVFLFELF